MALVKAKGNKAYTRKKSPAKKAMVTRSSTKKPTRSSARSGKKKSAAHEPFRADPEAVRHMAGWFLLVLSLTALLGLVSRAAAPEAPNLLGPYLGEYVSSVLRQVFGKLPVLFAVVGLGSLGVSLLRWEQNKKVARIAIFCFLILVELSLLLSLRIDSSVRLFAHVYEENGGMLGVFLMRHLIQPVFGSIRWAPGTLLLVSVVFTALWGIPGLRPRLVSVLHTLRDFLKSLPNRLPELPARNFSTELAPVTAPPSRDFLTGRGPRPLDFDKLASARKKAGSKVANSLKDSGPFTPLAPADDVTQVMARTVNSAAGMTQGDSHKTNDVLSTAEMDAIALRRYRDQLAEEQRIKELNEWEDKRKGNISIAGMLAKKQGQNMETEDLAREVARQIREDAAAEAADTPAPVKQGLGNAQETQKALNTLEQQKVNSVPQSRQSVNAGGSPDSETVLHKQIGEVQNARPPHVPATPGHATPVQASQASANKAQSAKAHESGKLPDPDHGEQFDDYELPQISKILPDVPEQEIDFSEAELKELSERLESQLANFRVKGKVVGICTGPVITRFEIELAPGVKVSRISGLADDLALALRAKSLRILAPIPGKSAVGIEVPNEKPHIVYAKEILESEAFDPHPDKIRIVLGKDIAGDPYSMDLARAPHLLIAGQTGSGKSVCINTLMASILASKTPDELRMILVDPKVVELKLYENIPHLLHPVVTDPETAVQALQWACWEMDRRYDVLASAKVRNIAGYNKKFREGKLEALVDPEENKQMPFIMVVIDELADLMMVAGKDVEISIARIAQKARAVGIHLVLATQRPSTNVITGVIKANLPTRISFKVASQIDARTILDKGGAEKLLGRGDMLFRAIEDPEPVRVHGAFLADQEAEDLADACSDQNVSYPQLGDFQYDNGEDGAEAEDAGPRDDLFNQAAELVVHTGNGSVSMLQRRLSVGHARAGRIMDQLEFAGIVGKSKGSKAREILMNDEELMSFLSGDVDQIIVD